MLPIVLNVKDLHLAVVGGGAQAHRRLSIIDEAGAASVRVFAPKATPEMASLAGGRLVSRLPNEAEIAQCHLMYVADLKPRAADKLATLARVAHTLVNVEDVVPLCDFHMPAILRRGDLLLTVSTNGKSPGLAKRLKAFLAEKFPEIWGARLEVLSQARKKWRSEGDRLINLNNRTEALIEREGWLS